jgi:GWxTD domain-containing protein
MLCNNWLYAIDFSKINTAYWYQLNAEVRVDHQVAQSGDERFVFIRIKTDSIIPGSIRHLLQKNYEDPSHLELESFQFDTLLSNPNEFIYRLRFDPGRQQLLVIQYSIQQVDYYFPVEMDRDGQPFPTFYLTDLSGFPSFDRYLTTDYSFRFLDGSDTLFCYRYAETFLPADPPMGQSGAVAPNLVIDTIESRVSDYSLIAESLYFIQRDTFSTRGRSFYVGQEHFPRMRKLEELVSGIIYISRTSELNGILSSLNQKAAFDDFWLSAFSSPQIARAAIRTYYRKLANANKLFTDYKPGWKTDRGMLYTVYGAPMEVFRSNNSETWNYNQEAFFNFRIFSNLFTPHLYVLERNEEYMQSWVQRIRILRGGS